MLFRKLMLLAGALGFAVGCSRNAPPAPVVEAPVLVPQVTPPARPVAPVAALVPAAPALPMTPAPPFRLPNDMGGKKVAATLTPSVPAEPPMPRVTQPTPRTSALDRGEVPLPRAVAPIPRLPLPPARSARPSPPPERVPLELGQSVAENSAAIRLPETPRDRASTVELVPADLPLLAQQLPGRASLDDPTAELSAVRVVFTAMTLPTLQAAFVRFGIPDPFELAAQLRGKTAVQRELGITPVVVPPGKP